MSDELTVQHGQSGISFAPVPGTEILRWEEDTMAVEVSPAEAGTGWQWAAFIDGGEPLLMGEQPEREDAARAGLTNLFQFI